MGEMNSEQQQAQTLIDSVDARLSLIATQIERPTDPLLIVEIRDDRHVRVYGPGSLEDMTLTRLGLENAWKGRTNDWGVQHINYPRGISVRRKNNPASPELLSRLIRLYIANVRAMAALVG